VSGIVDEIEVLDALTLHEQESYRELVKRQQSGETARRNLVCVHVPDNIGADTDIVFFLNGHEIGALSAKKVAKLALKIKQTTHGE
jgi:hypothetical protein